MLGVIVININELDKGRKLVVENLSGYNLKLNKKF